jgi:hypothetical protein
LTYAQRPLVSKVQHFAPLLPRLLRIIPSPALRRLGEIAPWPTMHRIFKLVDTMYHHSSIILADLHSSLLESGSGNESFDYNTVDKSLMSAFRTYYHFYAYSSLTFSQYGHKHLQILQIACRIMKLRHTSLLLSLGAQTRRRH